MNRRTLSRLLSVFLLLFPLCATRHAAAQTKPLAYLLKYVGQSPYGLWKTQPLQQRLTALLGPAEFKAFVGNLNPATDLTQQNGVLYVTGNAPHRGTEEEAVMLVDVEKDSIEVFILHKETIVRGWAENNRLVAIPKDVQETMNHWPKQALMQTLSTMRQSASAAGGTASSGAASTALPAAARSAVTPVNSAPRVCQSGSKCDEVNDYAATITDFRTSVSGRDKLITATVRFTNKLNHPLIIGLVQNSPVAIDDQGNRYVLNPSTVRGIGLIGSNNSFDPKFTLQAGESADARVDLVFQGSSNVIYGTSWEFSLALREIDPAGVNQYRMGRESSLRFDGLANRMVGSTVASSAASSSAAAAAGAPVTNAVSSAPGIVPASAVAGSRAAAGNIPTGVADACNGAPKCYSTGIFSATIKSLMASSVGNFHDHVLRYEITFRNVTNQPMILAYAGGSSSVIDNLGNQYYWGHAGTYDTSVQGIGVSQGSKVNSQFVLQPGESRNAIFQVIRYRPGNAQIGTSFTYSNSIELLELLPSGQVRTVRSYSLSYPDLTPSNGIGIPGLNNGTQNLNNSIQKLGSIFGKKK
jgi:hypothetical protein